MFLATGSTDHIIRVYYFGAGQPEKICRILQCNISSNHAWLIVCGKWIAFFPFFLSPRLMCFVRHIWSHFFKKDLSLVKINLLRIKSIWCMLQLQIVSILKIEMIIFSDIEISAMILQKRPQLESGRNAFLLVRSWCKLYRNRKFWLHTTLCLW